MIASARQRAPLFWLAAAAGISSLLLFWAVGEPVFTGAFLAGFIALGTLLLIRSAPATVSAEESPARPDIALLRSALDISPSPSAITDMQGRLLCANDAYSAVFGAYAGPLSLNFESSDGQRLRSVARAGRRDGTAEIGGLRFARSELRLAVATVGAAKEHLLWKFDRAQENDLGTDVQRLVEGEAGKRMGEAGLMAVLADGEGHIITANRAFRLRAGGGVEARLEGTSLVNLIATNEEGEFSLTSEGDGAAPVRVVSVQLAEGQEHQTLIFLLDGSAGSFGRGREGSSRAYALLDMLPLGLALIDGDGRVLYLNKSFRKTAGLTRDDRPTYPGDLVMDEDKAAVSDAVRRFASGRAMSGDLSVRLKVRPDEPVALTVAGARGLGDAAVLLSLKDNSEEDRLKRQVAQATKMQAVGQLAGGVAHDFNNILTAIIGHCDLMLMRHTPGDSDYDDIQQIRSNSNRAAGLTRQLLAFSRQQTLRPQILQLPDIISEVSNLLKRLLGETVTLQVKHGRNLGPVRADPGQLEQVVVNLAVNARDAMVAKGEGRGTLTIQTYSVTADDVRKMGSKILPIADYSALRVSDTGTGIEPQLLGKIFEPFFTTKEIGKGTGLGLSTVYGIVKQSGGFIFAESELGQGASFVIYLPVHRADAQPGPRRRPKEKPGELWGSGTILLVEDEAMVRAVAERALTRHGYTVLSAESGEAALEILREQGQVDLMISDVVMPSMDGPTTVKEARKTHPDLPILFISGYAEEQLRKSIDIDKVAFLPKPFSVHKLAEAARDAMTAK
jgi:two-component system, cell cycle sensor histidine kinase and response regulator CckA